MPMPQRETPSGATREVGDETVMLDRVQLSGLRAVTCSDCAKTFFVLTESTRRQCLNCEARRHMTKECCDRCRQPLGPVRFTRQCEAGVWCSRECRGDAGQRKIRKGGRPRKYKSEHERRHAERRQNA